MPAGMETGALELCLLRGDEVARVEPVGPGGLRLGRAADNDWVLMQDGISAHHATLRWEGGALVLTDLGGDGGTTASGRPVSEPTPVGPGDEIVLGRALRLQVRRPRAAPAWALEVDGLVRVPIRRDRLRLGGGVADDLLLPGAPTAAATLLLVGDEVRLATDDDDAPMGPDAPVSFAGTTLVLRRVDAEPGAPPLARASYPYHLAAALSGPGGPSAVVSDRATRREHQVAGEPQATFLWILGRRWQDDHAGSEDDRGWCADASLCAALGGDAARWRSLLCALRRQLEGAGLDGGCLERREGASRIRLGSVALGG